MGRSVASLTLLLLVLLSGQALGAASAPAAATCSAAPQPLLALCKTYCEALDCDAEPAAGAEAACDRVLDDYLARSKGKRPPCVASCPELCADVHDSAVARCEERFAWILEKCDGALLSCLGACPTCAACLADHGDCAATWSKQVEACVASPGRLLATCTQGCPETRAAR